MEKEQNALLPYMEYTEKKGWAPKDDAPKEIFDRYKKLCEDWDDLKRQAM